MTTKLKKELQTVNREIKSLTKKIEKMIVAVDKLEKAKPAKKAAPKAKATKKVSPKKVVPKKKAAKLTDTEKTIKIINRSKKGINVETLMKKTGFDNKKISNIVHRAYKAGKIKRVGIGIYVGA